MNSRLLRNFFLSLVGLVGAVVLAVTISWFTATTAATTFYYAVTEINPPAGYSNQFSPRGINDLGQVIARGYSGHFLSSESTHSFLWQNGTTTDLGTLGSGTLGSDFTWAVGINNVGQVVGSSVASDGFRHAFLWQNGAMTDLGTYGSDNSSVAVGINNNGQVVGSSYQKTVPSFTAHAVLWQNGGITDLGVLNGNDASNAYTINNLGQVFGDSFKYDTPISTLNMFKWQNGTMSNLGNIPINLTSQNIYIYSINNQGLAVGELDKGYHDGNFYCSAFLWQNGIMTDLGNLGNTCTGASDINEAGTVVGGSSSISTGSATAFMWRNGQIFNLNDLLQPNSGWQLISANGINNNGQIVGIGDFNGQRKGFLLTPVTVTN
jgi:probable HAF family extracellular repeat protein